MPRARIRSAKLSSTYRAQWFDRRNGSWRGAGTGIARSSQIGITELLDFPADTDWGLRLMCECASTTAPVAKPDSNPYKNAFLIQPEAKGP